MDESIAWLRQALSDRSAGERFASSEENESRCHGIAKFQQAVEKAIKAIVAALRERRVLHIEIGYEHNVERFMKVLIHLPRASENKTIQKRLRSLLDASTRAGIRVLDGMAPKKPAPGQSPERNTEYPFHDSQTRWTFPAATDTFSLEESQRCRKLAQRIADGAAKIISAIRRRRN